jgi:GLPGLI family protein
MMPAMKRFLFYICSFASFSLAAQNDSTPTGRVTYVLQVDLPADIHKNGLSTLLFNSSRSLFVHNSAPTKDSSFTDPQYYFPATVAGDKEGFPIYKLHSERKMYCKIFCRQSRSSCIVTDTLGEIAWTQHPEHKRFGQYDCRRATGKFRGREYEAWYTLDIPIPSGPYKLGGLPGLILEATSTDGKVKFLFSSLEMSVGIAGVIRMPSGKDLKVNYKIFLEEEVEFHQNLIKEAKAKGIEVSITRSEGIELETDN